MIYRLRISIKKCKSNLRNIALALEFYSTVYFIHKSILCTLTKSLLQEVVISVNDVEKTAEFYKN